MYSNHSTGHSNGRLLRAAALAASLVLMLLAPASAQNDRGFQVKELHMTLGRSIVIDYPSDVGRISTSNPDIVDAVAVTTKEILLHAKGQGTVSLIIWSRAGDRSFYNITVDQNLDPIRQLLKETFPDENIHVQASRDSLSLTGSVTSSAVADRAAALVAPFAKSVVNNLKLPLPAIERQVILHVKFAELNRSANEQFGANLLSTGATNTLGRITTGQFSSATVGGNLESVSPSPGTGMGSKWALSDLLNIFAFRPDLDLGVFIQALRDRQVLEILAEPNIVTSDGKEAFFHVGGEFPVPVLQGGSNSGAVTVQFREFGVRLQFMPNLTPNGTIKMHVRPEVSSVDYTNAVTLSGFTIPALSTRKMETNIELSLGQSFIIAGLIDDRVTDAAQRIPGLANLPILGNFFRSRATKKSKTELVVLVTPELAKPLEPGEKALPNFPKQFLEPATPAPDAKTGKSTVGQNQAPADADGKEIKEPNKTPSRNPLRAVLGKLGKGDD